MSKIIENTLTVEEKITEIRNRISQMDFNDKIYEGITLTYEQQTYERGKPKRYLELACELFKAINGKRIVEIGSMRQPLTHPISEINPHCCNDGHSTYFWCLTGAEVHTVDIDPQVKRIVKANCKKFKKLRAYSEDGVKFLKRFKKKIDMLFLDAWDVIPNTPYAENHVAAYRSAKDKLNIPNIVSIDDTDIGQGGKGRLLLPFLIADGYEILVQGRQTIAIKLRE